MPNSRACSATDPVILEPIAPPLIFEAFMSISPTLARPLLEYNKESNRILPKRILLVNVQEREDLSTLVQRRIRELGISNAEVARRSKLSRSYIGNIVNKTAPTQSGQYNLSPDAVGRLATAIEVSETEILTSMKYLSGETFADTLARNAKIKHLLGTIPEENQEAFTENLATYIEFMASQHNKPK